MAEENPLASADEPVDPATLWTSLGILPPALAARLAATVRGEVTDTVCRLLPGAASVTSARWLIAAVYAQLRLAPQFIVDREPGIDPGHARTAGTLPAQLMYAIFFELDTRSHGNSGTIPEPRPSAELLAFRPEAEQQVSELLGGYLHPAEENKKIGMIRKSLADVLSAVDEEGQPAWGGWLLLAAIRAIRAHPLLPRPGSRRRRLPWKRGRATAAGIAHQLAETLALAMALGLLDRAL